METISEGAAREAREEKVCDIMMSHLGKQERTNVAILRNQEKYQISLAIALSQTECFSIGTNFAFDDDDDEEDKLLIWTAEIAALITASARQLGILSDEVEFGFSREGLAAPWCFSKVPVVEVGEECVMVEIEIDESMIEHIIEIPHIPKSDDIKGWDALIRRIGKRVFGYY